MAAVGTDIVVVLSGGSSNTDPNLSLGGEPSNTPIIGVLNNLFDNIEEEDAAAGKTDYRCIYVFNQNSVYPLYEIKVYLSHEVAGGANVQLGLLEKNEIQRLVITGPVTSGYFEVTYTPPGGEEITVPVNYDSNPAVWAENLKTALNGITTLDCTVGIGGDFSVRIFNITFTDNRTHDLLEIDDSNLVGVTGSSVSKSIVGSPVNSIPPLLDSAESIPYNVVFSYPTAEEPLEIGHLYAGEGFPIWIERTVEEDTSALADDGFSLRIVAKPIILP